MEILGVLEKKIAGLIELVRELKTEKSLLIEENVSLKEKLEKLESSLLLHEKSAEDKIQEVVLTKQEIVLTKMVVDDIIKSIDLLVEQESQ